MFPLPAAGCPMAPPSGRCARFTERERQLSPERQLPGWTCFCHAKRVFTSARTMALKNSGEHTHETTASCVLFGRWPVGHVAGERRARRGAAGTQGRSVGDEGAERRVGARDDDAAMHRRDHGQGHEHRHVADSQGYVLEAGHPKDVSRLCHRFSVRHRRHDDQVKAEITGDFNSAYTVKSSSHSEGGMGGAPRDSTTTIEAKWLGACKADQKPGDIMMPGGMKM